MNDRRLSLLFRTPAIVEAAVRVALADALAARRMRLGTIDARSFGNRALEHVRATAGPIAADLDALGRHELDVTTVSAATRFFGSKLGRRLFTIDAGRLAAPVAAADALVRDERGRAHVIRVETCASDDERVRLGRSIARDAAPRDELLAPRVHLFSLRDGRMRSFTFTWRSAHAAA